MYSSVRVRVRVRVQHFALYTRGTVLYSAIAPEAATGPRVLARTIVAFGNRSKLHFPERACLVWMCVIRLALYKQYLT